MATSVTFRSDLFSTDRVRVFFSPLTISIRVGDGPTSQEIKVSETV